MSPMSLMSPMSPMSPMMSYPNRYRENLVLDSLARRNKMTYNPCPKCGAELEMGYGLAGGGMGPYMYCSNERCNFLQKFQDPEMETEGGKPFPLLFDNDWLEQKIRTDPDIECEAGATAGHSEGGDDTVRQAAKEVGYSDDAIDGFYAAMDRVKG